MKGKTKEEAFKIGQEIADKITELSPPDVVLKFEKVYLPSILISKKRYKFPFKIFLIDSCIKWIIDYNREISNE